jgi:hypothetical protein
MLFLIKEENLISLVLIKQLTIRKTRPEILVRGEKEESRYSFVKQKDNAETEKLCSPN